MPQRMCERGTGDSDTATNKGDLFKSRGFQLSLCWLCCHLWALCMPKVVPLLSIVHAYSGMSSQLIDNKLMNTVLKHQTTVTQGGLHRQSS
jgi:hypothetical protein